MCSDLSFEGSALYAGGSGILEEEDVNGMGRKKGEEIVKFVMVEAIDV